jgi:hypothetical protein
VNDEAAIESGTSRSGKHPEGPVVDVSYIKIKPGMFDAYMKWFATDRKAYMEELKKAGIILDWHVYGNQARSGGVSVTPPDFPSVH